MHTPVIAARKSTSQRRCQLQRYSNGRWFTLRSGTAADLEAALLQFNLPVWNPNDPQNGQFRITDLLLS